MATEKYEKIKAKIEKAATADKKKKAKDVYGMSVEQQAAELEKIKQAEAEKSKKEKGKKTPATLGPEDFPPIEATG